jgi:hypothetical protein
MKKTTKIVVAAGLIISLFTAACNKNTRPESAPDNISSAVILAWNEVAYEAMGGATNLHGLLASRIYAMMHGAMHDAVNATQPRFETYAFQRKDPAASPEVAAASAAHHVLKVAFPARLSFLDSALNNYLATVQPGEAKIKGVDLGVQAAIAILELGHNSNGAQDPILPPTPSAKAGDYQVVPPFNFIFAPFWEHSKLFSLEKKDQFRPVPPPALNSNDYTVAFNEVKNLGGSNGSERTADQTFFAKYWYEYSEAGWNRIARVVASNKKAGLFKTARLFALLNFAIADSYTAGWDAKLHYNFWRPYTAIHEAAVDGNDATTADLNWKSGEPTPPIQDYPSTHSVLGNSAATVLAYFFGDKTSFTMASPTASPVGAFRTFASFSQAADENALSRVMGGIHFRFSCNAGQELGNKIGKWTVENHLNPFNGQQ